MNNFEDIQKLWQQTKPVNTPPAKEMLQKIRQQQNRENMKMIAGTVALVLTFFFILFIAFHYHFTYVSTNVGIGLILFSIVAAVFMNSRMISVLLRNKVTADADNKTMLAKLEQYQKKQVFFQTTFLSAYYLLLTAGILLYMYEVTKSSILFACIAYSLTLAWIAFAWWYIRPRITRKQKERMDEIIRQIKSLQDNA